VADRGKRNPLSVRSADRELLPVTAAARGVWRICGRRTAAGTFQELAAPTSQA
jgi:hypothetical protein